MISRPSTLAIADAYTHRFSTEITSSYGRSETIVRRDEVYDFLYSKDYEAWFCNLAKNNFKGRDFKEWILKIHTGESLTQTTKEWSWEQRRKLGQQLLYNLSRDHLRWFHEITDESWFQEYYKPKSETLLRRIELDGYAFSDGNLFIPSQDILNIEHEKDHLKSLYLSSKLGRTEDAFEFLKLSEKHFIDGLWSDAISNVRKFFELTLSEGARSFSTSQKKPISEPSLNRPVHVRNYLEIEGLIEKKERETIDKIYGLLSETGAHPYMAESDQARLLRQLALTLSQFILLRIKSATSLGP